MSKCIVFIVAMLVCIFSVVGSVRAVTIDPFDTNDQVQTNVGTTGPVAVANALGGFRELEVISKTGILNATIAVLTGGGGDLLSVSNDSGVTSVSKAIWNSGGGGMNENLTAFFADAILLDFVSIDVGDVNFTVSITDILGEGGDTATKVINNAGTGINVFAFDTFTNFAAVDFTQVAEVSLLIETLDARTDLELRLFSTREENEVPVPEPATVLLLGIGIVGLGGGYLRKRIKRS
jgi:hypothetical protein